LPEIVAANGDVPSGPLLLKMIISRAHVDSQAPFLSSGHP
jgi:hypothetical protein